MIGFKRKHQILLIFSIAFLTTFSVFSQNILQEEPPQDLKEVAKEAAEIWQKELALSDKQKRLMEKKIIEFTMKKNTLIQSKMREEAKTERLQALQQQEHRDMRDILTKPQFERYLELKQQLIRQQGKSQKSGK